MSEGHYVYVLTDVTRKASEQRRVVISGFDVRWRTVAIAMVGAVPGIALAGILWPLLNTTAILALPATIGVIYFMVEFRSKSGLHLPMWKQIADKRKSTVGSYFMCNVEIDPMAQRHFLIQRSSVTVEKEQVSETDDLSNPFLPLGAGPAASTTASRGHD